MLGHFWRDVSRLWSPEGKSAENPDVHIAPDNDVAKILLNRPGYEGELGPDAPQKLLAQIIAWTVRRGLPRLLGPEK